MLLGRLQDGVPVCERPFAELGAACGLAEAEVLERVRRLKRERIIRQISAIFDTRSLGYRSSLVAARVDPARVEAAAAVVSGHPGVSHNYLRNHPFNLWFTIAVGPASRFGLAGTVALLHRLSGAESTRLLPALQVYKIGVRFDVGGEGRPDDRAGSPGAAAGGAEPVPLTPAEIGFVREMQRDLVLVERPFAEIAGRLGVALGELAATHERFLASGRMRRFAAVLHHRRAGFRANAMGVWAGPDDAAELDRLGAVMAGFRAVSHCYRRPTFPDWPYNLFTMVHGRSEAECRETLAAIAQATGIDRRAALDSLREFKKERVRYFTAEEREWEERHG